MGLASFILLNRSDCNSDKGPPLTKGGAGALAYFCSLINLKGGVGKTTITIGAAHVLSGIYGKRVLVVDLDPQMNATLFLLGEERWSKTIRETGSVLDFLKSALSGGDKDELKAKHVARRVGDVNQVETLDLLPAAIDLAFLETNKQCKYSSSVEERGLMEIAQAFRNFSNYDVVLFDCPPSLGWLTMSALSASDGYFIPTFPDVLSSYGIPQLTSYLNNHFSTRKAPPQASGIVVNRYRSNLHLHRDTVFLLEAAHNEQPLVYPRVLKSFLPDSAGYAAAAEFRAYTTLKEKWGYYGMLDHLQKIVEEMFSSNIQLDRRG